MQRFLATLVLSFFLSYLNSQNLIPNPSFEDVNICAKYDEECCPSAWRSTTLKNFRYSKYNSRNPYSLEPADGAYFISLIIYNSKVKNERNYAQVPLLCQLQAGQTYELSMYFNNHFYKINSFGAYFTDELRIDEKSEALLNSPSQVIFDFSDEIESKKWYKKSVRFVATGNEKGMIIGNFSDDDTTIATPIVSRKVLKKDIRLKRFYTKIDRVSLRAIQATEQDCDLEQNRTLIYSDVIRHTRSAPKLLSNSSVKKILTEENIILTDTVQKSISEVLIENQTPTPVENSTLINTEKPFELSNINFETNSARLLPIAYTALDELANYLILNPSFNLTITGHTDNVGRSNANKALSERRAQAVATYLAGQGVRMNRLSIIGKGEDEPITENETEMGRLRNRRVEFRLDKNN